MVFRPKKAPEAPPAPPPAQRPAGTVIRPHEGPQTRFLASQADIAVYGGAAGSGKLLPLDTPIPTPFGWVAMGDLRVGSDVFDERGKLCRVTHLFDVDPAPDLYRLRFDDQTEIDCCKDHLWLTFSAAELTRLTRLDDAWRARRRDRRASRALTTPIKPWVQASITRINRERIHVCKPSPTGSVRSTAEIVATLRTNSGRLNHAVPVAAALDLPHAELPIAPYVLGAWLGDGTGREAALTTDDPEVVCAIEACGYVVRPWASSKRVFGIGSGLVGQLRRLSVLDNKHIPPAYLRASRAQRLDLLRGLMDTDGTVDLRFGSVEFCNTNPRLADGVFELIVSLGWKVRKRVGRARLYGIDHGPKWMLQWTPDDYVFTLTRKRDRQRLATRRTRRFRYISSAECVATRPGRCIAVDSPSHLYLAGGSMLPTHNSWGLLLEPLRHVTNNARFAAVVFRRNTTQLRNPGGLWDQSMKLYPQAGGIPNYTLEWRWPKGGKIKFAHLEHETTKFDWHGAEIPLLLFDELTTFTSTQFWYLLSRNRSMSGVRGYIRATCNPDADSWVAELIEWWIDQTTGLPIEARSGAIRWFVRQEDRLEWGDSAAELTAKFPDVIPKSLTFVRGNLADNPTLEQSDPGYRANLMAMQLVERERLLGGNWKIRPSAGLYFRRDWCAIVDVEPAALMVKRGWDLAATKKTDTNNPDWTCCVKMGRTYDGKFIVLDARWLRGNPGEVKRFVTNIASQDGKRVGIQLPQDPAQAGKFQASDYAAALAGYVVRIAVESGEKVVRFSPFSAQCEAGNVTILRGAWNERFLSELEAFPEAAHDDMADATSTVFKALSTYIVSMGTGYVETASREQEGWAVMS